jgi:hypothetical protein
MSEAHVFNIAGHALVGCAAAVAQGGKCGPGALSAAAGSFAGPILKGLGFQQNLVAHAVVGGLASVAGGGNFANGAVTAAFGYLFNQAVQYEGGKGNPFAMTPEFQARFAGTELEAKIVDLIRSIEQGDVATREQLRATDDALQLPGGRGAFYDIYEAPSPNGTMGGRIANVPGHNYYYYSPYHYTPTPDVPAAWIQFRTSGPSIFCLSCGGK